MGAYKQDGDQLLTQSDNDRRRENGFKVKEERFRLNIRRKFFTQREVRYWHSCPEKLYAPSLQALGARLDGPWAT